MKENGNIHIARKNGYGKLVDSWIAELERKKKWTKPEAYLEQLEQDWVFLHYSVEFFKRQSQRFQLALVRQNYEDIFEVFDDDKDVLKEDD